jgi:hypothetical protein
MSTFGFGYSILESNWKKLTSISGAGTTMFDVPPGCYAELVLQWATPTPVNVGIWAYGGGGGQIGTIGTIPASSGGFSLLRTIIGGNCTVKAYSGTEVEFSYVVFKNT